MERYVCIHCHFYQPPRENPWLEEIEVQDSAYPYHDWNERITAECYAPNGASRILNGNGRITKIVNNYSRISFNFGPTLLSWMEKHVPLAYERIIDADYLSRDTFSGHGSAIAQAYNHMILPLANRRDKYTQVLWGIRDFRKRFRRDPEGMWLPETAVDLETLDVLSEQGIRFTILAPHQAKQVRLRHARQWRSVEEADIDPTRPYYCHTRSGRKIALFFYDGPISRGVAFEKLLSSGETFAQRLLSGFDDNRKWEQLMHIATDGETYGHHHAHGDMALAYALDYIESNKLARLTNYGEYLEKHQPLHEVEIVGRTAWSCAHGVGRWESDCGCNSGGRAGWNQAWRSPLRESLDWLRDQLAAPYDRAAGKLLKNARNARNEYISIVLDRSSASVDDFFRQHAARLLTPEERIRALKLLEMQRYLMLMFTSCGWFFDELTGIETVQVIQYAGRALQLGQELFGDHLSSGSLENQFIQLLSKAVSNLPEFGSGDNAYRRFVKPATVNLPAVLAHYAVSSLFSQYPELSSMYAYTVERLDSHRLDSGRARLILGQARVTSRITHEQFFGTFGVLHFGDHMLNAGVREFRGQQAYQDLIREASEVFNRAELPGCIRIMDRHFEGVSYTLSSLFRDEQRRAVQQILHSTLAEAEISFNQIYNHHATLMHFLNEMHHPLPRALSLTAEFVTNTALRRAIEQSPLNFKRIHALLDSARREGVNLDSAGLEFALRRHVTDLVQSYSQQPASLENLQVAHAAVALARLMPFNVDLWQAQNIYYQLMHQSPAAVKTDAAGTVPAQTASTEATATETSGVEAEAEKRAAALLNLFISMGDLLGVEVPSTVLLPILAA